MYDPEDPRCARLTLTGRMVEVGPEELDFAREAMFSRCVMGAWDSVTCLSNATTSSQPIFIKIQQIQSSHAVLSECSHGKIRALENVCMPVAKTRSIGL